MEYPKIMLSSVFRQL